MLVCCLSGLIYDASYVATYVAYVRKYCNGRCMLLLDSIVYTDCCIDSVKYKAEATQAFSCWQCSKTHLFNVLLSSCNSPLHRYILPLAL